MSDIENFRKQRENQLLKEYEKLFSDEKVKARAFDRIAQEYFFGNFNNMNKEDMKLLMFSILNDRLTENNENYDAFKLSNFLGISPEKIDKLMKDSSIKYPVETNWKDEFENLENKVIDFENGYILFQILNPYNSMLIKNEVEKNGGYVDFRRNKSLLAIKPNYFYNLITSLVSDQEKKEITKTFEKAYRKQNKENSSISENLTKQDFVTFIKSLAIDTICETLENLPGVSSFKPLISAVKRAVKK